MTPFEEMQRIDDLILLVCERIFPPVRVLLMILGLEFIVYLVMLWMGYR